MPIFFSIQLAFINDVLITYGMKSGTPSISTGRKSLKSKLILGKRDTDVTKTFLQV